MVTINISVNGNVTGDFNKIIAYEGQSLSSDIKIIHPMFSGATYSIEYRYNNTIYKTPLDAQGMVQIEVGKAGYVKCQFVAIDINTGNYLFKSNYWNMIIKKEIKLQPSHYPCSHHHTHPHHDCECGKNEPSDFNAYEAYKKLADQISNEEDVRFAENMAIVKSLDEMMNDIKEIKEKLKIEDPDDYMTNLKLKKLEDYLYSVTYNDYDYNDGIEYLKKYNKNLPKDAACSSVQNGFIRGRNYDWTYDEMCQFVITVPKTTSRYGSIGVAHGIEDLNNEFVNTGIFSETYRYLPFVTVDGMNTAGLIVNINNLPAGDKGYTINTNPDAKDVICTKMITRLLLDKCATVNEAINLIKSKNIYAVYTDSNKDEAHFMVSDALGDVAIIEFIPNASTGEIEISVVRGNNAKIMTNFYLTDYDGTRESLTPHACGIERYDILKNNYNMGTTTQGMLALMKKVYYTQAYDLFMSPFWYSDFSKNYGSKYGDLTKDNIGEEFLNGDISKAGDYAPVIELSQELYQLHERNGKIWHTMHTSVYNWLTKSLTVLSQEGSLEHTFKLDM